MRNLYPRCEHGRVIEQGECFDCLRAENERLKAARLEHSSLCEGSVGLPCDLPSVCDPLRAEVERLTRERDEARADYERARADFLRCAETQRAAFADAATDADLLRAEVKRLRGLIAQVEWRGARCPWCGASVDAPTHTPGCPAFSAKGEVRK